MNPADLVTPQILSICEKSPIIVVCGYTKTGKVTIARKISETLKRRLFISDDYQIYGPQESMYVLMNNLMIEVNAKKPFIVEGVQCFRLLRKGIEQNKFFPDLIIKTNCNEETIRYFYKKDNEEEKTENAIKYNKGLTKIWEDYLKLLSSNPHIKRPKFIELNTSIF